jgi:hypothetical protein
MERYVTTARAHQSHANKILSWELEALADIGLNLQATLKVQNGHIVFLTDGTDAAYAPRFQRTYSLL